MKASRLLRMLMLLQARGQLTADALAAELGVSARTVYRDLAALSEAGVPVYAETGRYGGIRLVDGYRTQLAGIPGLASGAAKPAGIPGLASGELAGMTGTEAETLFLAGIPDAAAQLGLGTVAAAAQTKVLAALPTELRARARRVTERFYLDAPRWFDRGESVPCLTEVAGAVWDGRRLVIRYRGREHTVRRTVDPLGLVLKAGRWYLVARHRDQPRTYRLSRIVAAEKVDAPVSRPPDFDLAEAWSRQSAEFVRVLQNYPVTALMSPAALGMFRRSMVPHSASEVDVRPVAPGEFAAVGADWLVVRLRTETLEVGHGELLRLGPEVEVLEPAELRAALATSARGFADRYQSYPTP